VFVCVFVVFVVFVVYVSGVSMMTDGPSPRVTGVRPVLVWGWGTSQLSIDRPTAHSPHHTTPHQSGSPIFGVVHVPAMDPPKTYYGVKGQVRRQSLTHSVTHLHACHSVTHLPACLPARLSPFPSIYHHP